MTNKTIIVENLMYRYGGIKAVNGISFSVEKGEILGFLGPNGAGKTTTVKMLTGQMKPMGGNATLLGMDIVKERKKIHARIGVCFEETNLYEQMSAQENLVLFARLSGVKSFDAGALLKRVGLETREKDKVETYSKGMKQRLMVARALVNNPDILFLDEPTEGLDPVSSQTIRSLILEEQKRGTTVFLTTHDMNEADKLSDHVAFINQGMIMAFDTPHNLKQEYGKRALKIEVLSPAGKLESKEIIMDRDDTGRQVEKLLTGEKVVTVHSEEASLEDIFFRITGRGLV